MSGPTMKRWTLIALAIGAVAFALWVWSHIGPGVN